MNNFATVNASGILRMERVLPAPIERVWAYLAEPDKRAAWLAGGTMAQAPGGRFELHFDHTRLSDEAAPERFNACNEQQIATSHIVQIEAPRLLTMTWDEGGPAESEVSFELTPQGAHATRLVLTHRRLPDRKQRLSHASGWHAHLDVLDAVLEGRKPDPFWTNFAALETDYEKRLPA